MTRYRVRPSKPVAVLRAIIGIAMIVVIATAMPSDLGMIKPAVLVAAGCIVLSGLWEAFARNGSARIDETEDRR